jgi:CRP-like cAMP-binding protein
VAETDNVGRLLLKLRARDVVTQAEEEVLRAAVADVIDVPAGKILVRAGATLSHSTLVIEGIVSRYKDLSEGQRQIQERRLHRSARLPAEAARP